MLLTMDLDVFAWDDDVDDRSGDMNGEGYNLRGKMDGSW